MFRKECKQVIKSEVSGAGAEEMYAPRLRHYDQLLFLCDQEAPHSSTSSMQEEEEDSEVNLLFFLLYFTLLLHLLHIVCVEYTPSELESEGFLIKYFFIYFFIQGVTGGKDQTSGGCSLC
jgi:hypothetical protein